MRISHFVFALAAMICWGVAPLFGKAAMLRIDPWTGLGDEELRYQPHHVDLGYRNGTFPPARADRIFKLGPDLCGGDFGLSFGPSRLFLRHQIWKDLPSDPHHIGISIDCYSGWPVLVFGKDKLG